MGIDGSYGHSDRKKCPDCGNIMFAYNVGLICEFCLEDEQMSDEEEWNSQ